MANTCGDCLLYQGSSVKCVAKYAYPSSHSACDNFKGPASFFNRKCCGGCRLYQGSSVKCVAKYAYPSSHSACNSYAANPG
jgi:hypothetical protein